MARLIDESVPAGLLRWMKEIGVPLRDVFLNKFGLALAHIRAAVDKPTLFEVNRLSTSLERRDIGLMEEREWQRRLTPNRIRLFNTSPTSRPVITAAYLVCRLKREDCAIPIGFQNYDLVDRYWTRDFLHVQSETGVHKLPILESGTVVELDFPTSHPPAIIAPDPEWCRELVSEYNAFRDRREWLLVILMQTAAAKAAVEMPDILSDIRSQDPIRERKAVSKFEEMYSQLHSELPSGPLIELLQRVEAGMDIMDCCDTFTRAWLVVVLDDESLQTFKWKPLDQKFEATFLSGGLAVAG